VLLGRAETLDPTYTQQSAATVEAMAVRVNWTALTISIRLAVFPDEAVVE
jgi:hypothetical protein